MGYTLEEFSAACHAILTEDPGPKGRTKVCALVRDVLKDQNFVATHLGIPVSTTHTITGAIIGVGATRRISAVKWGVARRIVWAWVLTIPLSAFVAAASYYALHLALR